MPDQIEAAGRRLFERFGACAADPDNVSAGRAADEAIAELDALLAASAPQAADGSPGHGRLIVPGRPGGPRDLSTQTWR